MKACSRWLRLFVALALLGAPSPGGLLADDSVEEPGADEMAAAHEEHLAEHGGTLSYLLMGDRLEYLLDGGEKDVLWDFQGWYGGDYQRLWIKTEGERGLEPSAGTKEAEIQALYSRALTRYFDLQAGVRHDFEPNPSRSYAVVGVQGLAPQWFEVDIAFFLSEEGDLSARFETEYELLLTQRLILQPRAELELSGTDVPELGLGSGLTSTELGVRLRYEFRRELAPYVGFSWTGTSGGTADLARAAGEPTSSTAFLMGIRFWY